MIVAWEALKLMKKLGLTPKRTIRVVGWTNEENGSRGGRAYAEAHKSDAANHVLMIESDGGVKGCPSLQSSHYVGGTLKEKSLRDLWTTTPELAFNRARGPAPRCPCR